MSQRHVQDLGIASAAIRSASGALGARVDIHEFDRKDGSRMRFRVYVDFDDSPYFWGETADAALWAAFSDFKRKAERAALERAK